MRSEGLCLLFESHRHAIEKEKPAIEKDKLASLLFIKQVGCTPLIVYEKIIVETYRNRDNK